MSTHTKTQKTVIIAVLSAVIAVVSFILVKTLGLEITLSMVPVAVGAICFSPSVGAILGGVFGLVSFLQCFGYSAFGALLLNENFIYTFLVCVPTRILAGFLAGVIAKALKNTKDVGLITASLAAPILNTAFFMAAIVLLFYKSAPIQDFVGLLGATNPFMFIILFVGINAVAEIFVGCILAYPISKALKKYLKI